MSISAVGALASYTGSFNPGATTLSVNPSAVGDVLVLVTNVGSTTHHATGVSGGGVALWQHVVAQVTFSSSVDLWFGQITTVGPAIVTVAGPLAGFVNQFAAQQFTGGSVWAVDSSHVQVNTHASTTIKWPVLVPAGSNELYVGFGIAGWFITANTQTAGYTLDLVNGNAFLFDPSVSSSQSPSATIGASTTSWTLAALISAS